MVYDRSSCRKAKAEVCCVGYEDVWDEMVLYEGKSGELIGG
jgi:hypothetical protein